MAAPCDPYRIESPAVVSVSGGRTSGMLLWEIREAHGGQLPDDVKAAFENTGKEDERTLDFVAELERRWHVVIRWLEYMRRPGPVTTDWRTIACHGWVEVNPNTASRKGEPFEQLLDVYADFRRVVKDAPPVLPNPVQRFCSGVLKQRVMHWWVTETLGWDAYTVAIGLRADEPRRVKDMTAAYKAIEPVAPLARSGVVAADVLGFWSRQPFDLALASDPVLGTYEGNCDFCFLKSSDKIRRLARERPEAVRWWAEQEQRTGQRFRRDRFSMTDLYEGRVSLGVVGDKSSSPDLGTCFCTD
jgi:hypothetical protein